MESTYNNLEEDSAATKIVGQQSTSPTMNKKRKMDDEDLHAATTQDIVKDEERKKRTFTFSRPAAYHGYDCHYIQGPDVHYITRDPILLVGTRVEDSVGLAEVSEHDMLALMEVLADIEDAFGSPQAIKPIVTDGRVGNMIFIKLDKAQTLVYVDEKQTLDWAKCPKVFRARVAIQIRGIKQSKTTGEPSFMKKIVQVKVVDGGEMIKDTTKYLF
jgi:hypothetical protein